MKQIVKLATTTTPGGGEMILYQHDCDFSIKINGNGIMNSCQHESEMELARLGCAHLSGCTAPHVLIGRLGMVFSRKCTLIMPDFVSKFPYPLYPFGAWVGTSTGPVQVWTLLGAEKT